MGLDWDAPAYSDDDPADATLAPLPRLHVELGPFLSSHVEHYTEPAATLVERFTARIKRDPKDADAYHHRAHALIDLWRFNEAIDDLTQAIGLRPDDAHFRVTRGWLAAHGLQQYAAAIADLEATLVLNPDFPQLVEKLADFYNSRAWELVSGPGPHRELARAQHLAKRAVELDPGQGLYLNTLGVAQYRAGHYAEAVATLEKCLARKSGQLVAVDWFFLAMARHRLGDREEAGSCFKRALGSAHDEGYSSAHHAEELAAFRAEAEAVLAGRAGELPDDVFAGTR